jgi:hypothetical protein
VTIFRRTMPEHLKSVAFFGRFHTPRIISIHAKIYYVHLREYYEQTAPLQGRLRGRKSFGVENLRRARNFCNRVGIPEWTT